MSQRGHPAQLGGTMACAGSGGALALVCWLNGWELGSRKLAGKDK